METITLHQYTNYNETEIMELYISVGWKNYYEKTKMLKLAYENSLYVLGAYIGNKLIGIIRVVVDDNFIIYIQDIIVLPLHQRKSVGSLLIQSVMGRYKHIHQITLLTDNKPKTVSFYKSIGFNPPDKFRCISFVSFQNN